jgi:RNA polymerase sigma-70 factor, ECF subfamily
MQPLAEPRRQTPGTVRREDGEDTPHDGQAGGADAADVEAVRRVLAGDTAAFSGIVERWQSRLINLAWRFCRDRSVAEDMAQDAFVKAFNALGTFRGEARFSTWLIALSLNCYRSALRSRGPVTVNLELWRPADLEPSALTVIENRERDELVRQLVATLPPRYRDPMVLFYFQEMSVAETARVLGIPEGTLKARLSRARDLVGRRYAARLSARKGLA